MVISDIGIDVPYEVSYLKEHGIEVELHSPVDHCSDIVPLVTVAVRLGISKGNRHKHIGSLLVIELEIKIQSVPETEMEGKVGSPGILPGKIFITRLDRSDSCITDVV